MSRCQTIGRAGLLVFLYLSPPSVVHAQEFKRHFVDVRWDSIATINAGDTDIKFYNPLALAAFGDSVAVVDYGDMTVKCFSRKGELIGKFGKRGRGPWEVTGLTGVILGGDGNLWVGDRGNLRAYGLDRRCKPLFQVMLKTSPARVFATGRGSLFVSGAIDAAPTLVDSTLKSPTKTLPLVPLASAADRVVRAEFDVIPVDGGGIAIAYWYGSAIALYDQTGSVSELKAPDGQEFPPLKRWRVGSSVARVGPDPSAKRVSNGIATDGKRLFVLNPSYTENDREVSVADSDIGNVLDVYSIEQRRYIESWKLPRSARTIAFAGGYLLLLSREPEPSVSWWKPQ